MRREECTTAPTTAEHRPLRIVPMYGPAQTPKDSGPRRSGRTRCPPAPSATTASRLWAFEGCSRGPAIIVSPKRCRLSEAPVRVPAGRPKIGSRSVTMHCRWRISPASLTPAAVVYMLFQKFLGCQGMILVRDHQSLRRRPRPPRGRRLGHHTSRMIIFLFIDPFVCLRKSKYLLGEHFN